MIIVEYRQPSRFGNRCDDEIRDRNAVAASARESFLYIDSPLENVFRDRDRRIGESPTPTDLHMLMMVAGAEKHLEIDNGAGCDLSGLDERRETLADRLQRHPRESTLVRQVTRSQERQAPAMMS